MWRGAYGWFGLSNIEMVFARELQKEVRLGTMLNGIDDESQELVSAYPQSVAVSLLLYGAEHNGCLTSPKVVQREGEQPASVQGGKSNSNDIFSMPQPTIEVPQPTEQKVESTTTAVETVVEVPTVEPKKEQVEEQVETENKVETEKEIEDRKPTTPEEEQPKRVEEKRPKMGWASRFRHWVDDMFTNDNDYL